MITTKVTEEDLLTHRRQLGPCVIAPHSCVECPFRYHLDGDTAMSESDRAGIANRIKNLGGFPCHMAEGHTKAMEWEGQTKHVCQGWLEAGGDQAAFERRFVPYWKKPQLTAEKEPNCGQIKAA